MFIARYLSLFCGLILVLGNTLSAVAQNPTQADSTKQDSAQKKKMITPKAFIINPNQWVTFAADSQLYNPNLLTVGYWDEWAYLAGFSWNLGQVGKPYKHLSGAFSDEYQNTQLFKNPFTRQYDVYSLSATALKYFDTKTPYLRGRFDQASRKTQLLEAEVSQNILPIWNSTLTFKRRTASGSYLNNTTDHVTASWTNCFRSFDRRYKGTFAGYYSQLNDELNGGSVLDSNKTLENAFLKQAQVVALSGTKYSRRTKGIQTHHVLLLKPDSMPNNVGILLNANWQQYFQQYADPTISPKDTLSSGSYPWKGDSVLFMDYHANVVSQNVSPGFLLKFGKLIANFNVGMQQDVFRLEQNSFTQYVHEYQTNLIFRSEQLGTLSGNVRFAQKTIQGKESRLHFDYLFAPEKSTEIVISDTLKKNLKNANKSHLSVFQYIPHKIQIVADVANTAPAIIHLRNFGSTILSDGKKFNPENLYQLQVEYALNTKPKLQQNRYIQQQKFSVGAYFQQLTNQIYPDSKLEYHQSQTPTSVTTVYLAGKCQWRSWHIEPEFKYLHFLQKDSAAFAVNQTQPKFRATCNFYFQRDVFKHAANLTFGLRGLYLDSFSLIKFDPASQQFFPDKNPVTMWSYLQLDTYATLAIKTVIVYLRLSHLNEGMPKPGYMTTLGYPMLERTFSFGVDWRFFD